MKYYLIFAAAAIIFGAGAAFCELNGKIKTFAKKEKYAAIGLGFVFFLRYYFYEEYAIRNVFALAGTGDNPVVTAFATIGVWFLYAILGVLVIRPFFNVKFLNGFVKWFGTAAYVLCLIFLLPQMRLLMGAKLVEQTAFSCVMYPIEIALGLTLCVKEWFTSRKEENRIKLPKIKTAKIWIGYVLIVLTAFPSYALQVFFGKGSPLILVDDFTVYHRCFLYAAFIIPMLLYFYLRDESYDVRRFAMTYIAVVLMTTFCTRYKIDTLFEPTVWPLHLCNTAMFIVPVCLVFNAKRLFYFTYFINVLGAFLAMAMPNYEDVCIFQWSLVNFWVNHYPAFFMPLLLVALKIFDRPQKKEFYWSMLFFAIYFVFIIFVNAWFTNFDKDVNFFFLNGTFIPDKFGKWALDMYYITVSFKAFGLTFTFHPLYQAAFFLVYVLVALAIWFVYAQFFALAEAHGDLMRRNKKIRQDKIALQSALGGRSLDEPMDKDAGIKLELKNFSKKYATSKNYAVKDACLTVNGGEIFGFLGPNGAGKSTIIKSTVGIQPATEGDIFVCGYSVTKQPRMAKSLIGFVPDHYALYENLTGREYINYIADIYDVSKEDRTARIDEMVSLFELNGSFDNPMKTYSHGMKQKITIMAALVHDPKLWILDEPLTGLDPNSIYQVKECMKRHAAAGNAVFFSSHIIDVVERICDRIAIIRHGEILCVKTVEEIEKECPLEEFYLKTINDEDFARKIIESERADGVIRNV